MLEAMYWVKVGMYDIWCPNIIIIINVRLSCSVMDLIAHISIDFDFSFDFPLDVCVVFHCLLYTLIPLTTGTSIRHTQCVISDNTSPLHKTHTSTFQ